MSQENVDLPRFGGQFPAWKVVARTANLYTLQGGRVTHLNIFQSKAEALEAAGLEE